MNIAKTFSALSLAFALQAGALVAATVVLSPSDASAATHVKAKQQKKAHARGKTKTRGNELICAGCNGGLVVGGGSNNPGNQLPGSGQGGGNQVGSVHH